MTQKRQCPPDRALRPEILPFVPLCPGHSGNLKSHRTQIVCGRKTRKKGFQVKVRCQVFHKNHQASRNQGEGAGGLSLTVDGRSFRDECCFVQFSVRKEVGQLIQATLGNIAGRALGARNRVRARKAGGPCEPGLPVHLLQCLKTSFVLEQGPTRSLLHPQTVPPSAASGNTAQTPPSGPSSTLQEQHPAAALPGGPAR